MSLFDLETTWRVHDDVETALLVDGRDYYRAFYAAALEARRSILLLGWQFDSDVQLLRGEDLPPGTKPEDVALLHVLDRLCREKPELEVRVLAWDHSVVFALEREVLQKLYFDATTSSRFHFRWDGTVPLGGSHHQKVAIIDGTVAFLGSQDLCQSRWDDSEHRAENPLRASRGEWHRPYHEVQLAVTGAAARSLVDLFVWRWFGATGEELDPTRLILENDGLRIGRTFPVTLPMPPARLALSRTIPEVQGRAPAFEVSELLVRAIERAEKLVYIESQYLTSCAVRDALLARMRDPARSRIEIVIVLPNKPEALKEEMTMGIPQVQLLRALKAEATASGHALGIYDVLAGGSEDVFVYIHSKLVIIDDRVFIVGSANFTNRSMAIDSEICAAYEAPPRGPVRNAIRRARVRLLMEHCGTTDVRSLVAPAGLVARLDTMAAAGAIRLRQHVLEDAEPGALVKAVHELTVDLIDPFVETCPPAA